jgi:hypothetical protein
MEGIVGNRAIESAEIQWIITWRELRAGKQAGATHNEPATISDAPSEVGRGSPCCCIDTLGGTDDPNTA